MNPRRPDRKPAAKAGAALTLDDYLLAQKRCLGQELLELRQKRKMSADDVAIPGHLSAQSVRNTEKGVHSPSHTSLTLHCSRLGATPLKVSAEVAARMEKWTSFLG